MEHRIVGMSFARIHALYVAKVQRKDRTVAELTEVLSWLTGYDTDGLDAAIADERTLRAFFDTAPAVHPAAARITGVVCGVRVEEIEDPLMQRIRWMDKLVDELAQGRALERVLRQEAPSDS